MIPTLLSLSSSSKKKKVCVLPFLLLILIVSASIQLLYIILFKTTTTTTTCYHPSTITIKTTTTSSSETTSSDSSSSSSGGPGVIGGAGGVGVGPGVVGPGVAIVGPGVGVGPNVGEGVPRVGPAVVRVGPVPVPGVGTDTDTDTTGVVGPGVAVAVGPGGVGSSISSSVSISSGILNITNHNDLLDVLDLYNRTHYCGWFKCFYYVKDEKVIGDIDDVDVDHDDHDHRPQQRRVGLFVGQDNDQWLPHKEDEAVKIHKNQSYYDIMLKSYEFSKRVEKEFSNINTNTNTNITNNIRTLMAGPPIELYDLPTKQQLNELNYIANNSYYNYQNDTFIKYIQKGSDRNGQKKFYNSSIIIQEVYEIPSTQFLEIRSPKHGEKKLRKFIKTTISSSSSSSKSSKLTKLKSFIQNFVNDLESTRQLIHKYPCLSTDFQIVVTTQGKIYQTDWDRIFFIYKPTTKKLGIGYDPLTDTYTNVTYYTLKVNILDDYFDKLINVCYEFL